MGWTAIFACKNLMATDADATKASVAIQSTFSSFLICYGFKNFLKNIWWIEIFYIILQKQAY